MTVKKDKYEFSTFWKFGGLGSKNRILVLFIINHLFFTQSLRILLIIRNALETNYQKGTKLVPKLLVSTRNNKNNEKVPKIEKSSKMYSKYHTSFYHKTFIFYYYYHISKRIRNQLPKRDKISTENFRKYQKRKKSMEKYQK